MGVITAGRYRKGAGVAEKTIVVCDVCGEPAKTSVRIHVGGRSLAKDLCPQHLAELAKGARKSTRGRPKGSTTRRTSSGRASLKPLPRRQRQRKAAATATEQAGAA